MSDYLTGSSVAIGSTVFVAIDVFRARSGWPRKRLKHVVTMLGGGTPAKDELSYWDGTIPWVSPKDMKSATLWDTEDHISDSALRDSAAQLVPVNSVLLVVRSGILRHTLPVALNAVPVTLNQDMKALVCHSELDPKYLYYLMAGPQDALLAAWRKQGATVESLDVDAVRNSWTPVPPLSEQHAIVTFLDRETARIDGVASKLGAEGPRAATGRTLVSLLTEKRQALITAAVTGQIDVSQVAV